MAKRPLRVVPHLLPALAGLRPGPRRPARSGRGRRDAEPAGDGSCRRPTRRGSRFSATLTRSRREVGKDRSRAAVRDLSVADRAQRRDPLAQAEPVEQPVARPSIQRRELRRRPPVACRAAGRAVRDGLRAGGAAGQGAAEPDGDADPAPPDADGQGVARRADEAGRDPGRPALFGPAPPAAAAPDADHGLDEGLQRRLRRLVEVLGDDPRDVRSKRRPCVMDMVRYYRLLLAAWTRQAPAAVAPADLGGDQPHRLGRHGARRTVGLAAVGPARLAALGRAARRDRRRGADVLDLPRELSRTLSAGRPDGRKPAAGRGGPQAAVGFVSAAVPAPHRR